MEKNIIATITSIMKCFRENPPTVRDCDYRINQLSAFKLLLIECELSEDTEVAAIIKKETAYLRELKRDLERDARISAEPELINWLLETDNIEVVALANPEATDRLLNDVMEMR